MICRLSTSFGLLLCCFVMNECISKTVHRKVRKHLETSRTTNVIVVLKEKDHVNRRLQSVQRKQKTHLSRKLLEEASTEHQKDFLQFVKDRWPGIQRVVPMWIANYICIDGVTSEMVAEIADHDDVLHITSNQPSNQHPTDRSEAKQKDVSRSFQLNKGTRVGSDRKLFHQVTRQEQVVGIPLHHNMTSVYKLWEKGYHGEGVVVGVFRCGDDKK